VERASHPTHPVRNETNHKCDATPFPSILLCGKLYGTSEQEKASLQDQQQNNNHLLFCINCENVSCNWDVKAMNIKCYSG